MVLKVVVCGGGIGGLTTALCIDRLCGDNVALEVFEQAPQYKVHKSLAEMLTTGNWRRDRTWSECRQSNAACWS
jgi:hypothetical protein